MSYEYFPHFYDQLMDAVLYDEWADFALQQLAEKRGHLLDMACGTGEIMIRMHIAGFQVSGFDLATEMVKVAQNKMQSISLDLPVYQANMINFQIDEKFDVITCFCDALNYLETKEELLATLKNVYAHLKVGGVFLFDVHSVYKMDTIFKDYTYGDSDEYVATIWNSFKDETYSHAVQHELTFFIQSESGAYMRKDEIHKERTYPISFYKEKLYEARFHDIKIYADFLPEKPTETSERLFFIARK